MRLVKTEILPLNKTGNDILVDKDIAILETTNEIKVFVWDSKDTMRPVSSASAIEKK